MSSHFIFIIVPCLLHSIASLFMQDPNNSSTRKPWYERAIEMSTLWKLFTKSTEVPKTKPTLWKTLSDPTNGVPMTNSKNQKLRKSTPLKFATSLTRVCLCVPISSYNEVFHTEIPQRRSYSYPRSKTMMSSKQERFPSARISVEGRRIFRGKSLNDNVLMRRFVVEEEAMLQIRRRNQMETIRKMAKMRRKKIGPSPLSRMILAEE